MNLIKFFHAKRRTLRLWDGPEHNIYILSTGRAAGSLHLDLVKQVADSWVDRKEYGKFARNLKDITNTIFSILHLTVSRLSICVSCLSIGCVSQ